VFALLAQSACTPGTPPVREAPNPTAKPANQLAVAGNACGPAALLNAFRFGSKDWQRASDAVAGDNDRERMLRIIREIGMRPSHHMNGRARWSRRGVSVVDLRDMANEMAAGHFLPHLNDEVFFLKAGETPEKLLRRVHQRLGTSLAKGFPPILSIRRYALRRERGHDASWVMLDAHFVTLTSLPGRIDRSARSFPVTYVDPWGGRRCEGAIAIPQHRQLADQNGNPFSLEAVFPDSSMGKSRLREGEKSILAVSAAIGRW
jgi:hypothetical protein